MTTEIPIVETIDLSDLLIISGETDEFIRKFNTQQQRLQPWSAQLSPMAQAINAVAGEISSSRTTILQVGSQVDEDKAAVQQLKSDVVTLKNQTEASATVVNEDKAAVQQLKSDVVTLKNQTEAAATTAVDQAGIATVKAGAALGSAQLAEYYAGQAENVSDITNIHLCGVVVSAPAQVREHMDYEITLTGESYLIDQSIIEFLVTDSYGSYTVLSVGNGATKTLNVGAYSTGDSINVSAVAVDSQGHRSPAATAIVVVTENQPPVGPITINHTTSVSRGGVFDLSLSGVTDPDGDDAAIRYEITDTDILIFSKTTDISTGELVQVTAPDVSVDTLATFSVRAYDDLGLHTATQSSTVNVVIASVIGVKMVATGGNGGTWAHINDVGSEIAAPSTSWFNAHPVWGGIVDQIIDGQMMVKIPKFYYRRGVAADGKPAWWISDQQISGFTVFPAFVLDGVEADQFWYGKYQASEVGGKLQSVAGVLPKVSTSLTDFLAMATARNTGAVEGFRLHHYDMWLAIQWLYLIESATMDSQTHTGDGRVSASGAANVDAADVAQATYRGIVGLWGNVYQWLDGVRTKNALIERRKYSGGWTSSGQSAMGSTYPITFRSTAADSFLPDTFATSNANATLPDQVYWYGAANATEYYPYVGGRWDQSANAGLWYVVCRYAASNAVAHIGSRLARVV